MSKELKAIQPSISANGAGSTLASEGEKMRTTYELTTILLAMLFGTLLFTSSLQSIVHPPYTSILALAFYYVITVIAMVFLGIAYYLEFSKFSHKAETWQSLGFQISLVAYVCLLIFLGSNMKADFDEQPSIEDVIISNLSPNTGDTIKLAAKVKGAYMKDIKIIWTINDKQSSPSAFVFVHIANNLSELNVRVEAVYDGEESSDKISQNAFREFVIPIIKTNKGAIQYEKASVSNTGAKGVEQEPEAKEKTH